MENFQNRIAVVGLQDERVLVEDDYSEYPDFVTLCETHHGYPATSLQWQPASALNHTWTQKSPTSELLATTSDALRVWEYSNDAPSTGSTFVGRANASSGGHSLTLKTALSGVRIITLCRKCNRFKDSYLAIQGPEPSKWSASNQLFLE